MGVTSDSPVLPGGFVVGFDNTSSPAATTSEAVRSDVLFFVPGLMTAALPASELAALFADIGNDLKSIPDSNTVLDVLVDLAARRVDGAEYAGVTVGRHGGRFETVAASHDIVRTCDDIQYTLHSGPCVEAVVTESTYNAGDLRTDPRWPEFGRRCVEATGIVSMLSMRFYMESDQQLIAGLNMYAHQPRAFDDNSEAIAHLLATHGALAVSRANAENKARNLERALQTSRQIGLAMGILMNQHKITSEGAFDLLRIASQHGHQKLAEIAAYVAETGALPEGLGRRTR
jgi:GAF domain-containing protein